MANLNNSIAEKVRAQILEIAKKMGNGSVSIGFLENATYADGTPVAQVAFWNEFGHAGTFPAPPRPFFRTMIAKESPTWAGKMAALAIASNNNGPTVLKQMGEDIQGALIQSLNETTAPKLSDTTLALRAKFGNSPEKIKASDVVAAQRAVADGTAKLASGTQAHPLIWTGHMLRSVDYEVKE